MNNLLNKVDIYIFLKTHASMIITHFLVTRIKEVRDSYSNM